MTGMRALFITVTVIAVAVLIMNGIVFVEGRLKDGMEERLSELLRTRVVVDDISFGFFDTSVTMKGISLSNTRMLSAQHSVLIKSVTLEFDLPRIIREGNIALNRILINEPLLEVDKGIEQGEPSLHVKTASLSGSAAGPAWPIARKIDIRFISIRNGRVSWRDHGNMYPVSIQIVDVEGGIEGLSVSPDRNDLSGGLMISGAIDPDRAGFVEVGGEFNLSGGKVSADITSNFKSVDLTRFAPYYENSFMPVINAATVDIASKAVLGGGLLRSSHRVKMYDIALNKRSLTSEERLFGATAYTVTEFFKQSGYSIDFTFDISGLPGGIKFVPGPELKPVITHSFPDRMAMQVGEIPARIVEVSGQISEQIAENSETIMKNAGWMD